MGRINLPKIEAEQIGSATIKPFSNKIRRPAVLRLEYQKSKCKIILGWKIFHVCQRLIQWPNHQGQGRRQPDLYCLNWSKMALISLKTDPPILNLTFQYYNQNLNISFIHLGQVTFKVLTVQSYTWAKIWKSGKCGKRTFCDISVKIVSNVNLTHHIL